MTKINQSIESLNDLSKSEEKVDAALTSFLAEASDEEFEDNEEKLGEAYDHLKNALECLSHFPFLGDESAKIKQVIQRLEKLAGAD